jgi:hypothetical protein
MAKKPMDEEFTLEKLKISDRLAAVEQIQVKFIERFDAHIEQDKLMMDRIMKILENHDQLMLGVNGTPGIKIDIDRLKQRDSMRTVMYGAIWVALIGLITKAIWSSLTLKT